MAAPRGFPNLVTPFVMPQTGIITEPWYKLLLRFFTGGGHFTGEIILWPAKAPPPAIPEGWFKTDGSAISRHTYADLFALIGISYGPGDGSTTFNIPTLAAAANFVYIIKT